MNGFPSEKLRVAILDLNNGEPNQSMRCLHQILDAFATREKIGLDTMVFDIRQKNELPDLSFDIYLSSGGPGNPIDEENTYWQHSYFRWLQAVMDHNGSCDPQHQKNVFFICYSFELACIFFESGLLTRRKSPSFGVFPVHGIVSAVTEPVFEGLPDPFYAVDSRELQVIQPDHAALKRHGSVILAIEKERPHVPLERCIMAIRFNENMIGTQFHPEADAEGMSLHLQSSDKKESVILNHGPEKWKSMIEHLEDPDKIMLTYATIIPNFLRLAINRKSFN